MAAKDFGSTDTTIGWVGTGVMGLSMCGHLMARGHSATVYTRTKSKAEGLLFQGRVPCRSSGTHGLTVRLIPDHEDLPHIHCTGLIRWA